MPRLAWVGLLLMLGGCASRALSTRDIYGELISPGIVCTPNGQERLWQRQDDEFQDRIDALRPWLKAQIGEDEIAAMHREVEEEVATTYYTGCPSEEQSSHERTRRWMLLHELENRARGHPLDPSPSGPASEPSRR